jgi:F0F1-type ATP synthase membrane subunit b/b'
MSYEQNMADALAALESQEKPNYKATAQEFNIGRTALSRRHQGKTTSRATANSEYRQLLTNAQEQQLINQINRLSVRHMPPTSQIVRNMAEEIIKGAVHKNWTANFVRRHKDELKSLYLRNIDNQRAKSEFALMFEHFYQLVINFLSFL